MLTFCVEFPEGHNFPCEGTEQGILKKVRWPIVVLKVCVRASCARLTLRKRSRSGNGHDAKLGSLQKMIWYELELSFWC